MNVPLERLRRTMHQRDDGNTVRLSRDTFLHDATSRAFGRSDVAELFFENTKYVPGVMEKYLRSAGEFEGPAMRYLQARIDADYPGHELIDLPALPPPEASLADVLWSRRSEGEFGSGALTLAELSQLFRYAGGVTATAPVEDEAVGPVRKRLRSYPSAGALYPVELYALVRRCANLDPGLYYYSPIEHGLRVLRSDVEPSIEEAFVATDDVVDLANANLVIGLTGAFPRATAKYGPRGYRYVLQESGHLAQNLQLVAQALGLRSIAVGGYYDDPLNDLLGVDGVDEAALYAVVVGQTAERGEGDR